MWRNFPSVAPGVPENRRQICNHRSFVYQQVMKSLTNSLNVQSGLSSPRPIGRRRIQHMRDRRNWRLQTFAWIAVTLVSLGAIRSAEAATWYVDGAATGLNNGTSWAHAWTSISSATGSNVSAGDTVFISTGTYANFQPKNGTSGNPITYKIGQDSGHNGTVTFTGSGTWLGTPHDVIISGDTGDSARHFVVSGYSMIMDASNADNWRLSFINFGNMAGGGTGQRALNCTASKGAELDNCYIRHDNSTVSSDAAILFSSDGAAAYDSGIRIHHNTILTWSKSDGGPDIIKCGGNGISIYNNVIATYARSLSGTPEHQDGIQNWEGDAQYYKIYNNLFYDLKNAAIVISAYRGGYQHMRMYNNLIVFTDSTASGSCQGGGFAINSGYNGSTPAPMLDCVVADASWYSNLVGQRTLGRWIGSCTYCWS